VEEIGLAMNAEYNTLNTKVKGSFDFNSSVNYSSYMIKLTQSFYTMVYDVPDPNEIFDESVTPAQLQKYIYDGNPGTYISSVNYGRIFYLLIQSTDSKTKVKSAIDASFEAVLASGSVEIDASHVNNLSSKKISGYAYGGDANLANGALLGNLENVQAFIKEGGTINNGAPLSYVVRSLYDPSQVVSTSIATKYTVTNC
jgi:thiol-activated cytolysin